MTRNKDSKILHLVSKEHVIDDSVVRDELFLLLLHGLPSGSTFFDPLQKERKEIQWKMKNGV